MALAHFRIFIHELLNKDPHIVPEEDSLILLDINYAVCMDNNGKYTKHTRHIARKVNSVKNGENWKMHKIHWCEGCMLLAEILTKNVGENYFNPRMVYIMVRLGNWDITRVQEGWHDTW